MSYDTSEKNRIYFDELSVWAAEVLEAGGSVREGRGLYIAEGWYGEFGEFDVATGEGWTIDSFK